MVIYSSNTTSSPLGHQYDSSPSELHWAGDGASNQDDDDYNYTQDNEQNQESADGAFNSWANDLDDETLPDMAKDELRILHALLFGSGDDAFSVADGLLADFLTRQAHVLSSLSA